MNDEQTKQVNTLLKTLSETKCCPGDGRGYDVTKCRCLDDEHSGGHHDKCETCNGSGLDPRTEMFRVKCTHHSHNNIHQTGPMISNHLKICNGYEDRPLTPAEAKALIGKMLTYWLGQGHVFRFGGYSSPSSDGMVTGIGCCMDTDTELYACGEPTVLLAILSAVASAVGVKVGS